MGQWGRSCFDQRVKETRTSCECKSFLWLAKKVSARRKPSDCVVGSDDDDDGGGGLKIDLKLKLNC